MPHNEEKRIELSIQTDRPGTKFKQLAEFVDAVRAGTDLPDDKVELEYDYRLSDHEAVNHYVDLNADWNQGPIPYQNGIVVRIPTQLLVDGLPSEIYRIAHERVELTLDDGGDGIVLDDNRSPGGKCILLHGVGTFTTTLFTPVRRLR